MKGDMPLQGIEVASAPAQQWQGWPGAIVVVGGQKQDTREKKKMHKSWRFVAAPTSSLRFAAGQCIMGTALQLCLTHLWATNCSCGPSVTCPDRCSDVFRSYAMLAYHPLCKHRVLRKAPDCMLLAFCRPISLCASPPTSVLKLCHISFGKMLGG